MSDTEQQVVPTYRPRRRWRRLIGAIVLIGVLALFVVLTIWAARPKWYTYISKPTKTSPAIALVLRVPFGWECQDKASSVFITVKVRRQPLTGVVRWWSEHVARLDGGHKADEAYTIVLQRERSTGPGYPANSVIYVDSAVNPTAGLWSQSTSRIFEHPLGTGHIYKDVWRRTGNPSQDFQEEEDTWIAVRQGPLTSIRVFHTGMKVDFSHFQSISDEIVRNVRVEQQ